jgi:predicted dehydrogenase
LKATSVGAAALTLSATSYERALGANERIAIGVIGCGQRGFNSHMPGVNDHSKEQNTEITAVSDPWRPRRERAAARAKEWYGRPARAFVSYRDVVALKDIDAVMIASCDHQHTVHLEAAAKAKKDIYCEKPLAMELNKLKSACDAVKASNVVVQIGTQLRSYASFTGCRKLYGSGALGTVSRIEQRRNGPRPYWYTRLEEAQEKDVDWREFLMARPMRPFDAAQFTGWYGYRDFSAGPVPGLGSHFIDLVHYITGARFPTSAVAQGGTFVWKDKYNFTCPDHVQATWIYPEGFLVTYSTNFGNGDGNSFRIYGNQGVLNMVKWDAPTVSGAGAYKKGSLDKEVPVEPVSRPDHYLDWLQCLRSRKTPNASIDAGYQHAVAVIMAMEAFDTGRRQIYDAEKREIRAG